MVACRGVLEIIGRTARIAPDTCPPYPSSVFAWRDVDSEAFSLYPHLHDHLRAANASLCKSAFILTRLTPPALTYQSSCFLRVTIVFKGNARRSAACYPTCSSTGAMLQVNRKLNSRGRNVTLRGDVSYTDSKSNSLSTNNVHLYQL